MEGLPFRLLWTVYEDGDKYASNGIETSVQKFFLGALQQKPRASAVCLESVAMENPL